MKLTIKIVIVLICIAAFSYSVFPEEDMFESKTTIGGYGELHYNHVKEEGTEASKTLDFHRFVIFFSHAWSEKWSFKAEVELEHNFVKEGHGELELEQAFIDYHGSDYFGFQVGVILPSVGLINDMHEPPLFMSVERPDYAKHIIPTTWFGNGIAFYGGFSAFSYKLTIMEGLKGDNISLGSGIRGARQKGFKALADAPLINLRLDYKGVLGMLVGASYSYNKPKLADGTGNPIHITEFHFKYDVNNVYAVFEIGNINYGEGNLETSFGYYVDLGYNIGSFFNIKTAIYPWFRWTGYNTASKVRDSSFDTDMYKVSKWLAGITVKPLRSVVFKIEFGIEKKGIHREEKKLFNMGAGYMF
jgi:hypothetical protein